LDGGKKSQPPPRSDAVTGSLDEKPNQPDRKLGKRRKERWGEKDRFLRKP